MNPPVIQIEQLSHRYGERAALQEVSFAVNAAEIFGLLGPNGSGKTTLFRILSTLMLPSSGSARVMGFDAAQSPADVRRHIGVVFQAQSIDLKLTAAENLWHQGHLYGMSGAALDRRIQEVLEHVGLEDRARERTQTFSGGMQRRVELAKGLLHRPSVLLLDEPTTGLDPGARRDLWQYLKSLREREQVTRRISERFGGSPAVLDGKVRLEREHGHRFVTDVVEAFPGEIEAMSVSKPTLEDVFIDRTGHRFWTDEDHGQSGAAA